MTKLIDSYRIEAILGRGAMGVVYKCYDEHLKRRVAIKALTAHSADALERMRSEAQAQARLDHPNVAHVYNLIESPEKPNELYIVMKYVEGMTLAAVLEGPGGRRLPLTEACELFQQILRGLEYCHRHKVIHRDIKPTNVMITDGRVEIIDFGIALIEGRPRQTVPSAAPLGTPAYMSPEQFESPGAVDYRTDIYSAGVVLYEMLTGCRPFLDADYLAQMRAHLHDTLPDPRSLNPDLPLAVCEVVMIALHKEPQKRFQSAAAFSEMLEGGVRGFLPSIPEPIPAHVIDPVHAPPPPEDVTTLKLPSPSARLWRWPEPILLALILALVGSYGARRLFPEQPRQFSGLSPLQQKNEIVPSPTSTNTTVTAVPGTTASSSSVPRTVTPKPERPKDEDPDLAPPKAHPSPSAPDQRQQEIARLTEIAGLKLEIEQGLENTMSKTFDEADQLLDGIAAKAQRYPKELEGEYNQILEAREEVRAQRAVEARRQAFEVRLRQIQALIDEKGYPEAIKLAETLTKEPGVPVAVAFRAREQLAEAKTRLKSLFHEDTTFGTTTNTIVKPKKPRGR